MVQPEYQKVGESQPVLYIYYRVDEAKTYLDGDPNNLRMALSYLSAQVRAKGMGDPYVILFNPTVDTALLRATGVTATSNYIGEFVRRERGAYRDLAAQVENYWEKMARSGFEVVPIAQIGWDTRPRIVNPVPWEHPPKGAKEAYSYYAIATPEEFGGHIAKAVDFMQRRPDVCPHKLLLIYSWNECDEGGCMLPTLDDPTGKFITAMSGALRNGVR